MAKWDFYEVLDVAKNASDAEIKKAYRRLAMKHYPDAIRAARTRKSASRTSKRPTRCCRIRKKRAAYDQYGHAGVAPNMAGAGQPGFGGFAEAFGDIFGQQGGDGGAAGRGRRSGPQVYRGADLRYSVEISRWSRQRTATTRKFVCRAG
jgi:molecular chaperone DnaJ